MTIPPPPPPPGSLSREQSVRERKPGLVQVTNAESNECGYTIGGAQAQSMTPAPPKHFGPLMRVGGCWDQKHQSLPYVAFEV